MARKSPIPPEKTFQGTGSIKAPILCEPLGLERVRAILRANRQKARKGQLAKGRINRLPPLHVVVTARDLTTAVAEDGTDDGAAESNLISEAVTGDEGMLTDFRWKIVGVTKPDSLVILVKGAIDVDCLMTAVREARRENANG